MDGEMPQPTTVQPMYSTRLLLHSGTCIAVSAASCSDLHLHLHSCTRACTRTHTHTCACSRARAPTHARSHTRIPTHRIEDEGDAAQHLVARSQYRDGALRVAGGELRQGLHAHRRARVVDDVAHRLAYACAPMRGTVTRAGPAGERAGRTQHARCADGGTGGSLGWARHLHAFLPKSDQNAGAAIRLPCTRNATDASVTARPACWLKQGRCTAAPQQHSRSNFCQKHRTKNTNDGCAHFRTPTHAHAQSGPGDHTS